MTPTKKTHFDRRGSPEKSLPEAESRVSNRNPSLPGKVRIIGGLWKRTPILVANLPGLRPTPDRVRETLFNWIGPSIRGLTCVDLFAGTGALGFEAASRGAAKVHLVEPERRLCESMANLQTKLQASQVEIHSRTAAAFLSRGGLAENSLMGRVELAFLDPPFAQGLWTPTLSALRPFLAPGARIYLEADQAWEAVVDQPQAYSCLKQDRAGQVHYHLLQIKNEE